LNLAAGLPRANVFLHGRVPHPEQEIRIAELTAHQGRNPEDLVPEAVASLLEKKSASPRQYGSDLGRPSTAISSRRRGVGRRRTRSSALMQVHRTRRWREIWNPSLGTLSKMAEFKREQYCVEQLANALTLPSDLKYLDPRQVHGRETGIDVIVVGGGLNIGFQVTEYDGGEGVTTLGKGKMRAEEKSLRRRAQAGVYAGWGSSHFEDAFSSRVAEKAQKSLKYDFSEVDQIWLLISAGLPDAPVATFLPHFHISVDILNTTTSILLTASRYDGAFLHVIMGDAIFEWGRETQWLKRAHASAFNTL